MWYKVLNTYPWVRTDVNDYMNRIISHGEEFRIIYVRTPHLREVEGNSPLVMWAVQNDFVQSTLEMAGKWQIQPQSGDQGQHQWCVMWTVCVLGIIWWEVFLPETHNPSLIMRKNVRHTKFRTFCKWPKQYSSKLSRSLKTKSEKLTQPRGA